MMLSSGDLLKWLIKIPSSTTATAAEEEEEPQKVQNGVGMEEDEFNKDKDNGDERQPQEEEAGEGESSTELREKVRGKVSAEELELLFPSKQTIRQLVLLNSIALPLNYGNEHSAHYQLVSRNQLARGQLADDSQECQFWTKMAYYRHSLVGAITLGRQLLVGDDDEGRGGPPHRFQVLILTLAVLPTFHRRGVASLLMEDALQQCAQWEGVQSISLHCQASNQSARAFYRRHHFVEVEFVPNYYSSWRIPEPDAYRLELSLQQRNGRKD